MLWLEKRGIHGNPVNALPPGTRHHHTELFSGILHTELLSGILITNQYLHVPEPEVKREGGLGKTQHKNGKQEISP